VTKREELITEIKNKKYLFGCSESALRDEENYMYLLKNVALSNMNGCPQNYECFERTEELCEKLRLSSIETCANCWSAALKE